MSTPSAKIDNHAAARCIQLAAVFQDQLLEEPLPAGVSATARRRQQALMTIAQAACRECPLIVDCLYQAIVEYDVAGYVAGTTPPQRAQIRRVLDITVEPEDFDTLAGATRRHRQVNHSEVVRLRNANPHESLETLAQRLGCSLSTVKRHLRRERRAPATRSSAQKPTIAAVLAAAASVTGSPLARRGPQAACARAPRSVWVELGRVPITRRNVHVALQHAYGKSPGPPSRREPAMSTTAWIILVIVIVVIVAVVAYIIMRSRAGARRARAEQIRKEAAERAAELDRKEAEANAIAAQAEDARAEADRLSSTSAEQREQTAAARSDVEDTLRKADRIDPDVRTRGKGDDTGGRRRATDDDAGGGPRRATDTRPGRAADEAAYDTDVRDRSVGDQDVRDRTVGDQDVRNRTVDDQDVRDRTVGDQDVRDRTVDDQDVRDRTVGDQDVRDRTDVGDRTAYDDQGNTPMRDERGVPGGRDDQVSSTRLDVDDTSARDDLRRGDDPRR